MLNLLTAFLIVFYLNHCFVRYQVCIDICHDLKKAVTDVMILAIGTIGNRPHATAVLMEFWRTLNLVHITAYESKDSTGLFSFRNFVLPTASAFGYEEFGMLTRAEVEQIEGFAGNRRSGSLYHYLLFSRLYRLAQTAIAEQYTSAAWPVWQSALAPLREASERLMHHATFRVPEIYVMCVGCVAFFTLWVDFFMLATGVGNSFRAQTLEDNKLCNSASGNGDCTSVNNQFGVLVCALTSLLVFATASLVEIILKAAHEFETPFGNDPMDLPVLTWVSEVARTTLEMVVEQSGSALVQEDTVHRVAASEAEGDEAIARLRRWRQHGTIGAELVRPSFVFRLGNQDSSAPHAVRRFEFLRAVTRARARPYPAPSIESRGTRVRPNMAEPADPIQPKPTTPDVDREAKG